MNKRLCIVRHRYYPGDPRIENQVSAAIQHGFIVSVVCMRQPGHDNYSLRNGVGIYRLPALQRKRGSKLRYALEYATFCVTVFLFLTHLHLRHKQDVIHVQNLPDFLVFAALVPKLLGAKIIQDFRECTPELYESDYCVSESNRLVKALIWIEQLSIRFADVTLTCTDTMRDKLIMRGAPSHKTFVMLNVPDPDTFGEPLSMPMHRRDDFCFSIVTHGTIKERYGHEVLIRAMSIVSKALPQAQLLIAGAGPLRDRLEQLAKSLGLNGSVQFTGFVSEDELLQMLRTADCGVVPLLRTAETDIIHTFKMFEYVALGIPVVISRTTAVEAYFGEDCFLYVEPGNPKSLAEAILRLNGDENLRKTLSANARQVYEELSLPRQQARYASILENLVCQH